MDTNQAKPPGNHGTAISTAGGVPDVYLERDPGMEALASAFRSAFGGLCAESGDQNGAFWDGPRTEGRAVVYRFARRDFPLKLDIYPARGVTDAAPLLVRLAALTGARLVADLGAHDGDDSCAIFHPSGRIEPGVLRIAAGNDEDNPLMFVYGAEGRPAGDGV